MNGLVTIEPVTGGAGAAQTAYEVKNIGDIRFAMGRRQTTIRQSGY